MLAHIYLSLRCLVAAVPLLLAAMTPCLADDDDGDANRAESLKSGTVMLCRPQTEFVKVAPCQDGSLDRLAREVDHAAKATLATMHPTTISSMKRDQVWFRQMMEHFAEDANNSDAIGKDWQKRFTTKAAAMLQERIALLHDIAQGADRAGVAGRWANAFGTVAVTPAANGAHRVTLSTKTLYGYSYDELQQSCRAEAVVRPGADGWLVGAATARAGAGKASKMAKPALVRIRRQGDSLRVVAGDESSDHNDTSALKCSGANQLTGSYFAAGKANVAAGHASASFVAPSFNCAHPATASEEEICADPDLATNDVRLNRAWRRLLPRLDAATRRLLTEDQRAWVKTQAERYPDDLHPDWAKRTYFVHWTALARDRLARLQRKRIAMLDGFDEKRRGFEGKWIGYNAELTVTRGKDGTLNASGGKWFETDYKGGCEYEFNGKADGNVFQPDDKRKNPDTMRRDHATLIVNRADDEWTRRRDGSDGKPDPDAGKGKCRRSQLISSTARLFPVRSMPTPAANGR